MNESSIECKDIQWNDQKDSIKYYFDESKSNQIKDVLNTGDIKVEITLTPIYNPDVSFTNTYIIKTAR